jgi:hypothetical protein
VDEVLETHPEEFSAGEVNESLQRLAATNFTFDEVDVILLHQAHEGEVKCPIELDPFVSLEVYVLGVRCEATLVEFCVPVNVFCRRYNAFAHRAKMYHLERVVVRVERELQVG